MNDYAVHQIEKQEREDAKKKCRYFGTECQANPHLSFHDYIDDMAIAYGYEQWSELPNELKTEARAAFREGRAAEKELQP
jgi:hypothetical protein